MTKEANEEEYIELYRYFYAFAALNNIKNMVDLPGIFLYNYYVELYARRRK
ncbi:MAG: hypothetical protein ACI4QX_08320 [Lachnospiraceae bacterium]